MPDSKPTRPFLKVQPSTDPALRDEAARAVRGVESDHLVRTIAKRMADAQRPRHADPSNQRFADQVHADLDALDPNKKLPVRSVVSEIAGRISERTRERRRTAVHLQPLGLPIWVAGRRCLCAVREHFVLSHPREKEVVTHWFETVERAREQFPTAKLIELPDYQAVAAAEKAAPGMNRIMLDNDAIVDRVYSFFLAEIERVPDRERDWLASRCAARMLEVSARCPTEHNRRKPTSVVPIRPSLRLQVVNGQGITLLTPRQEQVVALVAEGLSNREIAAELNLSEHSIKTYLVRIFDRLGVSSRVELVLYAVHHAGQPEPQLAPYRGVVIEAGGGVLDEPAVAP